MLVASAATKNFAFEFELKIENLQYLLKAFQTPAPEDVKNRWLPKRKYKPMFAETPNVVQKDTPNKPGQSSRAVCTYKGEDGKWHQHSQALRITAEHEQLGTAEEKRRKVAMDVQRFYNEHHQGGDSLDDAEEEPAEVAADEVVA